MNLNSGSGASHHFDIVFPHRPSIPLPVYRQSCGFWPTNHWISLLLESWLWRTRRRTYDYLERALFSMLINKPLLSFTVVHFFLPSANPPIRGTRSGCFSWHWILLVSWWPTTIPSVINFFQAVTWRLLHLFVQHGLETLLLFLNSLINTVANPIGRRYHMSE